MRHRCSANLSPRTRLTSYGWAGISVRVKIAITANATVTAIVIVSNPNPQQNALGNHSLDDFITVIQNALAKSETATIGGISGVPDPTIQDSPLPLSGLIQPVTSFIQNNPLKTKAGHSPTFCLLPVEVMNNDHWFLPSSRSVGLSLSFIACHTYIEAMLRYGLHSSAFSCTIVVDAISMRP